MRVKGRQRGKVTPFKGYIKEHGYLVVCANMQKVIQCMQPYAMSGHYFDHK